MVVQENPHGQGPYPRCSHRERGVVSRDPAETPKARSRGTSVIAIAAAFVIACVASFLLVAVGFGHRG